MKLSQAQVSKIFENLWPQALDLSSLYNFLKEKKHAVNCSLTKKTIH